MSHEAAEREPAVTFVGLQDGREIPWGNGGGSSRQLILRTRPDREDRLLWRMSTTVIPESCPFSTYTGFRRTITLLSGSPFTLDFSGQAPSHTVARFEPFDFNGGWKTHCHLPGDAANVLNVMADETVAYSHEVLTPGAATASRRLESDVVLFYALEGAVRLACDHALPVKALKAGEMLAFEQAKGASLEMTGDAPARILGFSFTVQR